MDIRKILDGIFEIKVSESGSSLANEKVNQISREIESYIRENELFYDEFGNFMEKVGKEVWKKSLNDYMSAMTKSSGSGKLAPLVEFIKENMK